MPEADQDGLLGLAEAVADRRPIDWAAHSRDSSPQLLAQIRHLRLVEKIDSFHRELARADVEGSVHAGTLSLVADEPPPGPVEDPPAAVAFSGRTWGSLQLGPALGRGASGEVYRAHDPDLKTDVALKLLDRSGRHLDEARKLARVRHPNVLTIHGVAIHDGQAGLWTELLEGQTLEEALQQNGPFSAQEAALIGIELCRALAAVHGAGLVHRDVKTANVMREEGGRIVLLDFSVGSERGQSLPSAIVGTPMFMAPELFRGEDSGTAADIYSLGVTLYRLVSGRYPIEVEGGGALVAAHRNGQSMPLLDARPDLPAPFVEVVERALASDPARRFGSPGEMERALSGFVGVAPTPAPATTHGLSRLAVAAVLLVGVGLLLGFAWRWFGAPLEVEARWVRVQESLTERLDPGATVAPGDCLELEIHGSRGMHVYVLNEDAAGNASVLFPSPGLDAVNPLDARQDHRLPGIVQDRAECWNLGTGGGEERMLVVASLTPLVRLEQRVADLARHDGSTADRADESITRGVTGRAPSPRSTERSRITEVVDELNAEDGDEPAAWVWQVRFVNRGTGAPSGALPPVSDDVEVADALRRDDATLLTDLALRRLRGEDSAEQFFGVVQALEFATRAAKLEPEDLRACGARAQALERVFLIEPARAEWDRCLALEQGATGRARIIDRLAALEPASGIVAWDEAREWIVDLSAPASPANDAELRRVASRFPNQTYALVERELLPLWGQYSMAGDRDRAERALARLRVIGEVLRQDIDDTLISDTVAHIDALGEASDTVRLSAAAAGHAAYGHAARAERSGDFGVLAARLGEAHSAFLTADSPYVLVPQYREAVLAYRLNDYGLATRSLQALREVADTRGYHALLGTVHWMEGLTLARQAELSACLERYRAAEKEFATLGDVTRYSTIKGLIAELFDYLGEFSAAWRERHGALARLPDVDDGSTRHRVLMRAARTAHTQAYPSAALEFGLAAMAAIPGADDPLDFITSSVNLAAMQDELGNREDALEWLALARARLADLDDAARGESAALVAAAEAGLMLESDPRLAARRLDDAIGFYEKGRQIGLARLLPQRGRAHQAAGQVDRAEQDFLAAIEFFEHDRGEASTVGYADLTRQVYDAMVAFQLTVRDRSDIALNYAERGRAQLLLESAAGVQVSPLNTEEIQRRVPSGVTLLYYALLDQRIVTWAISRGTFERFEQPVDASTLRADVAELRATVADPSRNDRYRQLAADFHDRLVRPIRRVLIEGQLLVVIPDKILHLLPFAMLIDGESGRFLVQDFRLAVSPSATFLLRDVGPRAAPGAGALSVLVVADPRFDRSLYPSLPDLAGAVAEANAIAHEYDSSQVLLREQATRSRFLELLPDHDVVHFAGHALASRTESFEARLLLAPEPATGDRGELRAGDLALGRGQRNQLVVLAACDTAVGRISTAEGPMSLARPFLAAGVPAVVASLWPIDDSGSAVLFTRFHEAYRKTRDAPESLREAQVAMIESTDGRFSHPSFWAASQAYVGASSIALR